MKLSDLTRPLYEEVAPEVLRHWTQYAGHRDWKSEEEARSFIAGKWNNSAWNIGMSPEESKAHYTQLAAEMPIYQTKKGWRIGDPRVLKNVRAKASRKANPRLTWKTMEIKGSSLYDLNNSAAAQEEAEYKILPVKMYRIAEILPEGEDAYSKGGEAVYIRELAQKIKENRWFEAIYVHENHRYVVEGQHRTRALKLLGFKTVPGYGFLYDL